MAQSFSQPKIIKVGKITSNSSINVNPPDPSISLTPSISVSPSITPSLTRTPSVTPSITATPSVTVTPSITSTPSMTVTPSITRTPSVTPSITISPTPSPSSNPYYLAIKRNCFNNQCNQYLGNVTIYGGGTTLTVGYYYVASSPSSFVYQIISQTSPDGSVVNVNSTGYSNCGDACLALIIT